MHRGGYEDIYYEDYTQQDVGRPIDLSKAAKITDGWGVEETGYRQKSQLLAEEAQEERESFMRLKSLEKYF